jgi:hypothetical protein
MNDNAKTYEDGVRAGFKQASEFIQGRARHHEMVRREEVAKMDAEIQLLHRLAAEVAKESPND